MEDAALWGADIEGDFPLHVNVVQELPEGTRVVSAQRHGISSWAQTVKISVTLADGKQQRYFMKCSSGVSARALAEGEFHSTSRMHEIVPHFVPRPIGWGSYPDEGKYVYFFLGAFHEMEFSKRPDPAEFIGNIVEIHSKGESPNGMFGFPVPTTIGRMQHNVTWEQSWAASFTHQLGAIIKYDTDANGAWAELEAASKHLIDRIIPRLLGVLQTWGRQIVPALIHGDLWERNVGTDVDTGRVILFDAGSTYAHNEMEFGTWRCSWATHFKDPVYMSLYQRAMPPSEPREEWDDRNRLYGIYQYLVASAGHPGSGYRRIAYNDVLYLCEKYSRLQGLEKYDATIDPVSNGKRVDVPFEDRL
ncbi:Fructosamine kinase-domain-containing protein [Xylariaceae sp. FL1272]|nr:Fructosamine kinase-domain-containing protein [Xylariaceae sp. FL1272]